MNIPAFETLEVSRLLLVVLLHFVWQATLICLIVAIARSIIHPKHFQLRYVTSVLGLISIVVCTMATTSYYSLNETAMASLIPADGTAPLSFAESQESESFLLQLESQFLSVFGWFDSNRAIWLACWAVGFLVLVGRLSWSLFYCIQLRRSRTPLPAHLQKLADTVRTKLKITRNVVVASSRKVSQAVATGIIKPVVLIPASWISELPVSAIEAVLAHELAHVKRWDLWINMLQRTAETVFFFHPLVWWLSKTISTEREICCDKLAIHATGNAIQYVETLATIANESTNQDFNFQFGTAFNGGKNMKLLRRAKMILEPGAIDAGSPFRALTLITCVGLLISFGSYAYCGFPEPVAATPQDESHETENEAVPITLSLVASTQDDQDDARNQTHDLHIRLSSDDKLNNSQIARQLRALADQLEAGNKQKLPSRIHQQYQEHAGEYLQLKQLKGAETHKHAGEYRLRLKQSEDAEAHEHEGEQRFRLQPGEYRLPKAKQRKAAVTDKWRENVERAIENGDLEGAKRSAIARQQKQKQKQTVERDIAVLHQLELQIKGAEKAKDLKQLKELEQALRDTELRDVLGQRYLHLRDIEFQKKQIENERLHAEHLRVQLQADHNAAELHQKHLDTLHEHAAEEIHLQLRQNDFTQQPGETSQDGVKAAIQGLRNEIEMLRHELQQLKADRNSSALDTRLPRRQASPPVKKRIQLDRRLNDNQNERIQLDLKVENDQATTQVPFLGQIPFVSQLFRNASSKSD